MAELTEELKLEIVTRLARFEKPVEIVDDLVSREIQTNAVQIGSYDPTRSYFDAGEKWRAVFDEVRRHYLTNVAAVPIANQGWRLNELQKLFDKAVAAKNYKLAGEMIEQASKEVGGVFTKVRDVNVEDRRGPRNMDPQERRDAFAELIRGAIERMSDPDGTEPQVRTQH